MFQESICGPSSGWLPKTLTSVVTDRNHCLQGQQEIPSSCVFSPLPPPPHVPAARLSVCLAQRISRPTEEKAGAQRGLQQKRTLFSRSLSRPFPFCEAQPKSRCVFRLLIPSAEFPSSSSFPGFSYLPLHMLLLAEGLPSFPSSALAEQVVSVSIFQVCGCTAFARLRGGECSAPGSATALLFWRRKGCVLSVRKANHLSQTRLPFSMDELRMEVTHGPSYRVRMAPEFPR